MAKVVTDENSGPELFDEATAVINGKVWINGRGGTDADIMVIGLTPTFQDNTDKTVFSKSTDVGRLIAYYLKQAGMSEDDIYYTNVVKYVMPNGKKPAASDIKLCNRMLLQEIERVKPKLLICSGSGVVNAVTKANYYPISLTRGSILEHPTIENVKLIVVHSFEQVVRDAGLIPAFAKDIKTAVDFVKGKTKPLPKVDTIYIDSIDQLTDIKEFLISRPITIALDCEWHGKNWQDPTRYFRTIQIGLSNKQAILIKVTKPGGEPYMDATEMFKILKEILEHPNVSIIGQNIIADGEWLLSYGIDIRKHVVFDTMLAEYVINSAGPFGLDELSMKYTDFGRYCVDVDLWVHRHPKETKDGYGLVPEEILFSYGAADVACLFDIASKQIPILGEQGMLKPRGVNGEYPSMFRTTLRVQEIIYELECTGLPVDSIRLRELIDAYQKVRAHLLSLVIQGAANVGLENFNPASVAQVKDLLFNKLGLIPIKTSDGKAWAEAVGNQAMDDDTQVSASTDKSVLEMLQDKHPLVKALLQFRRIDQSCKTWLRYKDENGEGGIPGEMWEDGKLHPRYSLLTQTGRWRVSSPNCFPGDVEVLTNRGWIRFDEAYSIKDSPDLTVAQWDVTSGIMPVIKFGKPTSWIKQKCNKLIHVKSGMSIDIIATENHRFTVFHSKTNGAKLVNTTELGSVPEYRIPRAGLYETDNTNDIDSNQVTLICAYQAEGCDVKTGGISWKFDNVRKADRLRYALSSLNIKFKEYILKYPTVKFYIGKHDIPEFLKGKKHFGSWLLEYSEETLSLFSEEIWHWDGCSSRQSMYTSKDKTNTDWVQIILLLRGVGSKIIKCNASTGSINWQLDDSELNSCVQLNSVHISEIHEPNTVYCCSTEYDSLIVRYKDKPIFTRNSQNWPKKAEGYLSEIFGEGNVPPMLRTIVKPPEGWVMMEADFCQAELFTLANLSGDPNMLSALTTPGKDLHDKTAVDAFRLTMLDEHDNIVTEDMLVQMAADLIDKGGAESEEFSSFMKHLRYRDTKGNIMTRDAFKSGIRVSAKSLNFGIPLNIISGSKIR